MPGFLNGIIRVHFRGVAQLVARTAGGREVAGSSPVTPTTREKRILQVWITTIHLALAINRGDVYQEWLFCWP